MTISQAIAALGISRATYYRLVRRGLLHPIRRPVPFGVILSESEVTALLDCTSFRYVDPVNPPVRNKTI